MDESKVTCPFQFAYDETTPPHIYVKISNISACNLLADKAHFPRLTLYFEVS